ncbi:MAG TPA: nucleotidyltransferase [Nitrospirae bacterium]|nr:nucleotidyltransferase [Nitrospirota bacterium]
MKLQTFAVNKSELAEFCRNNNIRKLSVFGSALTSYFDEESDIDLLVEFERGCKIGFFHLAELEIKLSEMFGRKVDLRTFHELSRYFRQNVLREARPLYARG